MTRIIRQIGKHRQITKVKDVFHDNKLLSEIDYTETTAIKEFCKIQFKGKSESFWIPHFKLNVDFKEVEQ